jgi:hypothetical protein
LETYRTDLPLSVECFSSRYTLSELFHRLIARLEQGNNAGSMKKIMPYFAHLLRLWGWGSGKLEKNEKIALLLSYWTHPGSAKTNNLDDDQDEQISVELSCWMKILCLTSENCDIDIFIDVFVLDILLSVQLKSIESQISSYQSLILEYSTHFPVDVAAWVS